MPAYKRYDSVREAAYVVFMRHGERNQDDSDFGLTPDGHNRARYLAKCVPRSPSAAFPLGPPTRLMASVRGANASHRPYDTLVPLSAALNLSIQREPMMDIYAPLKALHTLAGGDTLLVSWQHWFLPRMIAALQPPEPQLLQQYPRSCPDTDWEEPAYTRGDLGDGDCYGVVWQLTVARPRGDASAPWQAVRFAQLQQGFHGEADGACADGFAPIAWGVHADWTNRYRG